MESHIEEYQRRTIRSGQLYRQAKEYMPGGVNHGLRFIEPYPVYMRRGQGSRMWDVDGNEYIDLWMAQFCLILGHRPEPVVKAMAEAVESGVHLGTVHEHQIELAGLICEMTPCAERVRFCASGTEAAMYASRLARGYTGRRTIIKMEGGWHGAGSDLCVGVHPPYDRPECAGLIKEAADFVRCVPFNDMDTSVRAIRDCGDDLAAVIVEPVMGLGGFVPAERAYLEALREETERLGALLIFDEVVTGFWLAPGGAQEIFGIVPDLAVLGKPIGGGANIGAVTGRESVLAVSDPTTHGPKGEGVAIGGGTFSATPLTMISGVAALNYLKNEKDRVYPKMNALGERLRWGMEESAAKAGLRLNVNGLGPFACAYLPLEPGLRVRNAGDMWLCTDIGRLMAEMRVRMINHGIYAVVPGGVVSAAHTEDDVDQVIEAIGAVAGEMAKTG